MRQNIPTEQGIKSGVGEQGWGSPGEVRARVSSKELQGTYAGSGQQQDNSGDGYRHRWRAVLGKCLVNQKADAIQFGVRNRLFCR